MSLELSLVQPYGLERLVDVSPFAPDGLSDLSGAHSFLAQGDNARAIERGRAAFVNPLRLRGVDAGDPAPEFSWGGGGGSFRLAARRKR
jgi:hypothetical protein